MSNHIHAIASEVSGQIEAAEQAADRAAASIADLLSGTLRARLETGELSGTVRPTVLRLQRALNRAVGSGNDIARVHGDLAARYQVLANGDHHPYTVSASLERRHQAEARRSQIHAVSA